MSASIRRVSTIAVFAGALMTWTAGGAAAQSAQPTFSKDVAPVLYQHCTSCHRPGEIAPMSLLTYQDARPWARAIRDNVINGVMPPWHADPAHGKFRNDRRLSDKEKQVISQWVAAGAPEGDANDLPVPPVYTDGWSIGQPDVVLKMATPYALPATGEIPYQYFEVETNFTEDKWIQALEIRPGDRSVVHHVLVYAREPGTSPRLQIFRQKNPPGPLSPTMMKELSDPAIREAQQKQALRRGPLMAQTAPGTPATVYPAGLAQLVKAGTVLTFQIHYTTNGKPATDQTSIGFKFAPGPPAAEVRTGAMLNPRFMIPAGAPDHPVEAAVEFIEDVTIYSMVPHTHLRGKSWEHRIVYPDGREEVLLAVPKYDFNWQTEYIFAEPLRVPKGATLKSLARYDNSTANKANPDATQPVYWGDQTWEEMQYTALYFSVDKTRTTTQQR
jgi:mono/diheme cytochrome c family protein